MAFLDEETVIDSDFSDFSDADEFVEENVEENAAPQKGIRRIFARLNPDMLKKLKRRKKTMIILAIILLIIILSIVNSIGKAITNSKAKKEMYTDVPVERRTIQNIITGSSFIAPNDSYNVMTITSGDITADYFNEGSTVKKGDKLYQFDDDDARKSLASAKNALTKAEQSYVDAVKQKAQTVSSNNLSTQSARNSVSQALKSLDDAKNTYNDQNVTSDISGKVRDVFVSVGDKVNIGANIAEIYDDTYMKIRLPFNDYDAESVYVGAPAEVSLAGSGDVIYGTVTQKSSQATATNSRTMVVYATIELTNPGALTASDIGSAVVNGVACADMANFEYINSKTITAETSGTVESLNISKGDGVTAGEKLAYIHSDAADTGLTNAQLSYDNALISLQRQVLQNDTFSQDSNIKNAQLALEDAKTNLEKAQDAVDKFLIEAPIDGTVVTKNAKSGDTIDSSNGSEALCVIYDLSCVKCSIDVDETEIALVKVGQKATITADAVDGEFVGEVIKVPVDGVNQNGVTTYTIDVQINDYGELLPGMNIDAEIVVEEVKNVLAVPVNSVNRGDIVFVKDDGEKRDGDITDMIKGDEKPATEDKKPSPIPENTERNKDIPSVPKNIEIPEGYRAISVEIGINDAEYIEIKSGLKETDTVRTLNTESSSAGASFGEDDIMMMNGMNGGMSGGMGGGMPDGDRDMGGGRGQRGGGPR